MGVTDENVAFGWLDAFVPIPVVILNEPGVFQSLPELSSDCVRAGDRIPVWVDQVDDRLGTCQAMEPPEQSGIACVIPVALGSQWENR